MPREIVITSVSRGVKLGRTGFQVAMQTAGMRDDVAAVLEKMAGYRHLTAGAGASPICYFHRQQRTVIGQISVVGRIVDAGVDFSNRSNKLAHMVVLEAADLSHLAGSSPATMLAAIEGRLATRWTGGPEERQTPFSLAGIPQAVPAPCATWQQVMGDAGWAGVLAERAIHNQPTLVIGRDPSPASCRLMLTLFQEALAVVPAGRRWAITFDTTTLAPDGILWRGTYSGSPESQMSQPGLLVIDLGRPQTIPANMAAGEMVRTARSGPPQADPTLGPPVPSVGVTVRKDGGDPIVGANALGVPQIIPSAPGSSGRTPPPPGTNDVGNVCAESRPNRSGGAGWVMAASAMVLLLLVGGGLVTALVAYPAMARTRALSLIQRFADSDDLTKAPSEEDVRIAIGRKAGAESISIDGETLTFLNAVLRSKAIESVHVKDSDGLKSLLDAVAAVRTGGADTVRFRAGLLGKRADEWQKHMQEWFPGRISTYEDLQRADQLCGELMQLSNASNEMSQQGKVSDELWDCLISQAVNDGQGEGHYAGVKEDFIASLKPTDLASKSAVVKKLDSLINAKAESGRKLTDVKPQGTGQVAGATVSKTTTNNTPKPGQQNIDPAKTFDSLRTQILKFKTDKRTIAVPADGMPVELLTVDENFAAGLGHIEVFVGQTADFKPQAVRPQDVARWEIRGDHKFFAVIECKDNKVLITKKDDWDDRMTIMPIAFRLRGTSMKIDDWIVLGRQPNEERFESTDNLYNLLCEGTGKSNIATQGTSQYPLPCSLKVTPSKIQVSEGALSFGIALADAAAADSGKRALSLEFTAKVDPSPDDLTLRDTVTCLVGEDITVERGGGSWTERPSVMGEMRWGAGRTPVVLFNRSSKTNEQKMPTPWDTIPRLVDVLEVGPKGNSLTVADAKKYLESWSQSKVKRAEKQEDWSDLDTCVEFREQLVKYVASSEHSFGKESRKQFQKVQGEPDLPEEPKKPGNQNPEQLADYNTRHDDWKKKKDAHDAWKNAAQRRAESDARKYDVIEQFLKKNEQREKEADIAAVWVLRVLDGLMVAKFHRETLDTLLKRIPVAALIEGTRVCEWTIACGGEPVTVTVTVAELKAAEVPDEEQQGASKTR